MDLTRSTITFLIILCVGAPAYAEEVSLMTEDCQRLVRHTPTDDVTYRAGVDVHGNEVASADLGGGYNLSIPDEIDIQIGIDLADRLGLRQGLRSGGNPDGPVVREVLPYEGKAPIGMVTLKGNDVLWNGERIAPQDELILAEACRQAMEEVEDLQPGLDGSAEGQEEG